LNHSGQSDLANLSGLRHQMARSGLRHQMARSVPVLLMLLQKVQLGRLDRLNRSGLLDLVNL